MYLDGGGIPVILRQPCGHLFGTAPDRLEGHQHLHPAVIIADHRHKGGRVCQPADLLHLGQMLMGKAQTVALGCIQLAVGRTVGAFVVSDHLFAAAGIAGNTGAAVKITCSGKAQLHQRPHDADKPAGIAAGHRHAAGVFDLFFLAPEFREAVDPVGIRAESRGGIQHLDIRAEQGHDLFGSRIRQAEEGEVSRIDDLCPLVHVLAALLGDGEQFNFGPGGQTVGNAQTRGACGAVDKDLYAHALFASHAAS